MSLEDALRQGPDWEPQNSAESAVSIRPSGGSSGNVVAYHFEVVPDGTLTNARRLMLRPLTEADLYNSGWIKANEAQRGQMRVAVALERLMNLLESRDNPGVTAEDIARVVEGTMPDVPRRQRRNMDAASAPEVAYTDRNNR